MCIESASVSSSSINVNIFAQSPIWYCLLFFIITVFLIGKNRFNSILIICIVCVSIVLAINLLLALLNIRYIDYTLLLPIFKDRRISEYILCALTQLGSLSSLAIVLPILPRIDDKKNLKKNLNKHNTFNIYILCFVCCYTNINPRFFEIFKCFLSSICSNSKNLFWWFCREWKCFL